MLSVRRKFCFEEDDDDEYDKIDPLYIFCLLMMKVGPRGVSWNMSPSLSDGSEPEVITEHLSALSLIPGLKNENEFSCRSKV